MANITLYCNSCGYKFAPKTGKFPKACPYCSKEGTLEKAKQMQDYLDETLVGEE